MRAASTTSSDPIALLARVQHHPSRSELLPRLLEQLSGLEVEVVADPDPAGEPSPWRTYRASLNAIPAGVSHLLVIQDDAVPCDHFAEAAGAAVTARPDRPVALWVGGLPADACHAITVAARDGRAWVDMAPWQWFPCVAAVWPAEIARRLAAWTDAHPGKITRADDAVTARFMQAERVWPLATVPSLVEHPDVVPSVIGRRAWAGRDRSRVACVSIGDRDARTICW